MSYSFSTRGATREVVMARVMEEMNKVVVGQPIHAADSAQAVAATEAFLGVVRDADEKQDYQVSVNGSVGWTSVEVITNASVSVQVSLVPKVVT